MAAITPDELKLACDRARLEGRRMAHFPDKAVQDIANLRGIAGKSVPLSKQERDYLNGLADKLQATEDGCSNS